MKKIVVDSGPCGGKTEWLSEFVNTLPIYGFYGMVVPEAATLLKKRGITMKSVGIVEFQKLIVKNQLRNEFWYGILVRVIAFFKNKKPVLLCDRGILTGIAYMPENGVDRSVFFQNNVLMHFGLSYHYCLSKYDGVIHLVSTAIGAKKFFVNSPVREETLEQARELDNLISDVWICHPKRFVVKNTDDFNNTISFSTKKKNASSECLKLLLGKSV